jgi:hypothetical protein
MIPVISTTRSRILNTNKEINKKVACFCTFNVDFVLLSVRELQAIQYSRRKKHEENNINIVSINLQTVAICRINWMAGETAPPCRETCRDPDNLNRLASSLVERLTEDLAFF